MARLLRLVVIVSMIGGAMAVLRQRKLAENARRYGVDTKP